MLVFSGQGSALFTRTRTGTTWGAESSLSALIGAVSDTLVAATVDGEGALHLAVSPGDGNLNHVTNRLGGWSKSQIAGANVEIQEKPVDILTSAAGRVLLVANPSQGDTGEALQFFTYQNLIDDNCDGRSPHRYRLRANTSSTSTLTPGSAIRSILAPGPTTAMCPQRSPSGSVCTSTRSCTRSTIQYSGTPAAQ